jgi:ADP-ribose pyrophosphatase
MKILSEETIWEGSSWQFQVESVALPKNATMERGKIRHPGAVVLVPVLQTKPTPQILMIRQYRHVLKETILELPAGTRGWDEAWLDCAQRELQEETGHRADEFTELGDIWPAPGVSDELMRLYLAMGLHPDPLPADADEEIEVVPMSLDDCLTLVKNGRIRDAKTIIGVWKTAVFLKHPQ